MSEDPKPQVLINYEIIDRSHVITKRDGGVVEWDQVTVRMEVTTKEEGDRPKTQRMEWLMLKEDAEAFIQRNQAGQASQHALDQLLRHAPSASAWVDAHDGITLRMVTEYIIARSRIGTAWLKASALKYITIRVDMRDGNWRATDVHGDDALPKIRELLSLPPITKD